MSNEQSQRSRRPARIYPIVIAMIVLSVLLYGSMSDTAGALFAVLIAPVVFFLSIYVCFGIAQLAFMRQTYWLWGSAVVSVSLSYLLLGRSQLWTVLAGWSMLLFSGVLTGRLTLRGFRPRSVYIISLVTIVIFGAAQYFPLWREMYQSAGETTNLLVKEAEQQLTAIGEGTQKIQVTIDAFRQLVTIFIRLIPAETMLGAFIQYTVGYLLFARWIDTNNLAPPRYEPFIYWKMPFGIIPLVIMVILARMLGGELLKYIADNMLVILAVFYSATGLSLIEYYQRKIKVTKFMRVMFYVLLFLMPLVNIGIAFTIGGIISLLGFIDSFTDWRKIRLREFA